MLLLLQLGFLVVAYPALVITYLGQAAYLMVNPQNYTTTFYSCIPTPVYWPVFVISVGAAIVASQVMHFAQVPSPPFRLQHVQCTGNIHILHEGCVEPACAQSKGGVRIDVMDNTKPLC